MPCADYLWRFSRSRLQAPTFVAATLQRGATRTVRWERESEAARSTATSTGMLILGGTYGITGCMEVLGICRFGPGKAAFDFVCVKRRENGGYVGI